MPTTVYSLLTATTSGDTLASTDVNRLGDTAELFYVQVGELLGSGFFTPTDCNGTAVSGSLSLELSAGSAIVGEQDGRKVVQNTGTVAVSGLTASTTNYVFLQRDGTYVTNTTGTAPAHTLLACTAVTNGTEATSVNNAPTGRTHLGTLLALSGLSPSTPTITVGAEVGTTINVAVQLKDAAGVNVAGKTVCRVWLSDTAGAAVTSTAPDGAVAIGTNGVLIHSHTAKTHLVVCSSATGAFDLNFTHSGSKTYFLNLEYQGRLYSSSAVTF
jgi:hypothetical protein